MGRGTVIPNLQYPGGDWSVMDRLKTIDEIYDEVRGYDLVITNDAALETALNGRISEPRVGIFAITPRHIAVHQGAVQLGQPLMRDTPLIAAIRRDTGFDLRFIHSEIQNFRQIRAHTADVRKHLTTKDSRMVYDSYEACPTVERVMSTFDADRSGFFRDKRVAVLGIDLFDDLDKHFSPLDADHIDIFGPGEYEIEEMREVGNDRQLAENAVDLIDPEHPDDFALILNPTSPMADAVRSALYRKGIPFVNKMTVRELAAVRDYLSFLDLAFRYRTVRVRQVKELFAAYNGFFPRGTEEFLVCRVSLSPEGRAQAYRELMRRIEEEGVTFGEARDGFLNEGTRLHVSALLNQLDLADVTITPNELADLRYAVENLADLTSIEETPESERTGVLLADCSNSVFVDRPVVIYLGMGQDWNRPVVGKRYLDAEEENVRNARRMSALLQQGSRRVYLVNTTKDGRKARPTDLFDLITGSVQETFAGVCGRLVPGRWTATVPEEMPSRGEAPVDETEEFRDPFSKTSFDNFHYCPRKYMFGRLLSDGERKTTEFGNLIHAFAELYVCYGDLVDEMGLDGFVDMVSDRYTGLSSPVMEGLDRDMVRRAMESVVAYLRRNGVRDPPLDAVNSRRPPNSRNRFMDHLGLDACTNLCESDTASTIHPIHGHFDLIWEGTVVDYKTGRPQDLDHMAERMCLDYGGDHPEFQPLIYLALALEKWGSSRFDQFYVMDNDHVDPGDLDVADNVRTVRLSDMDLLEILEHEPSFREDVRASLSQGVMTEFDAFISALVSRLGGTETSQWTSEECVDAVIGSMGKKANKSNREKYGPAINKVAARLRGGMAWGDGEIIVPKATLERFLEELDGMHREAMAMYRSGFPARPRNGCSNCDFREACTVADTEEAESDDR